MAKITLGPIVDSIQGSIGGCCFRRIGAKFFASSKSGGPVRPGRNSSEQHAYLKQATTAWYELSAPVKQFWTRYHALQKPLNPRTGKPFPTAYSLFVGYQLMRLHCGANLLLDSVPDPPIFAQARVFWSGPFTAAGAVYQGTASMSRLGSSFLTHMALFCASSRDGITPARIQRKIFPTPEYGPGWAIANSNYLIYQKMGYPPGLTGLVEQPAPAKPLYLMRGWGLYNDLLWICPWTPPVERGTIFSWPVATPIVTE